MAYKSFAWLPQNRTLNVNIGTPSDVHMATLPSQHYRNCETWQHCALLLLQALCACTGSSLPVDVLLRWATKSHCVCLFSKYFLQVFPCIHAFRYVRKRVWNRLMPSTAQDVLHFRYRIFLTSTVFLIPCYWYLYFGVYMYSSCMNAEDDTGIFYLLARQPLHTLLHLGTVYIFTDTLQSNLPVRLYTLVISSHICFVVLCVSSILRALVDLYIKHFNAAIETSFSWDYKAKVSKIGGVYPSLFMKLSCVIIGKRYKYNVWPLHHSLRVCIYVYIQHGKDERSILYKCNICTIYVYLPHFIFNIQVRYSHKKPETSVCQN